MLINPVQTNFKGISLHEGGVDYLYDEGGDDCISRFHSAKQELSGTKWKLIVDWDGYKIVSPTTLKTHSGPFSIKRHWRKQSNDSKSLSLTVFMDSTGRTKYTVPFANKDTLNAMYKKIKNSKGLEMMVLILKVLESRFL